MNAPPITTILFAFGLTLFAGLATGVGGVLALFAQRTNTRFLSLALGFSAGVMIYVSFVEIIVKAHEEMTEAHGENLAAWLTTRAACIAAAAGATTHGAAVRRFGTTTRHRAAATTSGSASRFSRSESVGSSDPFPLPRPAKRMASRTWRSLRDAYK